MRFSVAVDQFWVEGCTSFMVMCIFISVWIYILESYVVKSSHSTKYIYQNCMESISFEFRVLSFGNSIYIFHQHFRSPGRVTIIDIVSQKYLSSHIVGHAKYFQTCWCQFVSALKYIYQNCVESVSFEFWVLSFGNSIYIFHQHDRSPTPSHIVSQEYLSSHIVGHAKYLFWKHVGVSSCQHQIYLSELYEVS